MPLGAPNDGPNDAVSGFGGVVVASRLGALLDGRFEESVLEFPFIKFADAPSVAPPHIGDDNNVLQRWSAAELKEHNDIPSGHPGKSTVGALVDVDDPGELSSSFVSVGDHQSRISRNGKRRCALTRRPSKLQ